MNIDLRYPWIWNPSNDLTSLYRSRWFGWWLVTWANPKISGKPWYRTTHIAFQPGL